MNPPQDVIELILEDHRTLEGLLRLMRSVEADRHAALHDFADLLIAHGHAEESVLHPPLRPYAHTDFFERIEAEHDESTRVLLALLDVPDIGSAAWDRRLQQMAAAVCRHSDGTERTLLNLGRAQLDGFHRAELAQEFAETRHRMLRSGCGSADAVHGLLYADVPA
ncbi:hemerythrin domain-containing protein [Streptomyces sp. NPDC059009]|uniref:hemerythrin domain-containing protein n=1 Tax=Streptomyces sp. NPDC059009 TaxID=3346694 RepID=UPI003677BC21